MLHFYSGQPLQIHSGVDIHGSKAVTIMDAEKYYVSELRACRLLTSRNLAIGLSSIFMNAADTFAVPTKAQGLMQVKVLHRLRVLSNNGPSCVSAELVGWPRAQYH